MNFNLDDVFSNLEEAEAYAKEYKKQLAQKWRVHVNTPGNGEIEHVFDEKPAVLFSDTGMLVQGKGSFTLPGDTEPTVKEVRAFIPYTFCVSIIGPNKTNWLDDDPPGGDDLAE